jgi:LPS O-antigen subunit length determinant protein (WzzB/FepE family)
MSTSADADELIFSDFFRAVRRDWKLVAGCTLGGGILAVIASFFMTPRYEAMATLMPVEGSGLSSMLGGMNPALTGLIGAVGVDIGSQSKEQEAVAILQSRAFAVSFIERENAMPLIFPELWDASGRRWDTRDGKPPSLNSAFKRFDRNIRTVRRNTETAQIQLSIRLPDRMLAAQWANRLATQLNDELRRRVIAEAEASLKFLDQELRKTDVLGIRDAMYKLVESQTKEIMLARVREQYALRIVDPAAAPDENDPAFPKRAVLAVLGALFGALCATLLVLFRRRRGDGPTHA